MKKLTRYSPEVRERAIRMVKEHQSEYRSEWAAIESIAGKARLLAGNAAQVGAP